MSSAKKNKKKIGWEENPDYIAYQNTVVYAPGDIPLHPAGGKHCLTQKEIWADFDPRTEPLHIQGDGSKYSFVAKQYGEGPLYVDVDVYRPEYPSKRAVLIVQEYGIPCQKEIITQLTSDGFTVFVPDYCGIKENTATDFPSCVEYGKYGMGMEHLTKVCPTAKETCNYLYTLILRRTITFIESEFSQKRPVLIGIRSGVEYAMQTAGCDRRVRALACLCGAGYSEFLSDSFYTAKELDLSPEKLAWLTGVAGVSYLIGADLPLFVGVGSNDIRSDVDRLSSLCDLVGEKNVRACICNGYSDNVTTYCFDTMKKWLRLTFLDASLPALPTVSMKINSDGTVYADVNADPVTPIRSTALFYAFDDMNHSTRNWNKAVGETVGKGEYLAHIPIPQENMKMLHYAHVCYENGVELSGLVAMTDFTDKRLALTPQTSDNVLYSFDTPGKTFTEFNEEPVLFSQAIVPATIPIGLQGALDKGGKMILFVGDVTKSIDKTGVLQVDCYSDKKEFDITLCLSDSFGHDYYASKAVYTDTAFRDVLFNLTDFKDEMFHPLNDWGSAKRLTVCTENIVIGKLLFI